MSDKFIAELDIMFVFADGNRELCRVGLIEPVTIDSMQSRCDVVIGPFAERRGHAVGGTRLQALLLASHYLLMRLQDFRSKGGRLLDPEEETDLPLEAYWPFLRDRSDTSH